METKTRTINARKYNNIKYLIIFTIIELFVLRGFFDIHFLSNDDSGLQATLNGTYTGTLYPYHQFVNVFLGYFICFLYKIFPFVQWWFVWSISCIIFGIVLLHYTMLRVSPNIFAGFTIIFISVVLFELYALSHIAFTLVPVYFSLGPISLLYVYGDKKYNWNWFLVLFVSSILLIASLHRYLSALVMFCFYGSALLYYSINISGYVSVRKKIFRYILTAAVTLITILAIHTLSQYIHDKVNGPDFKTLDRYRAKFMDLPHASYEEVPQIYKKYGWTETEYRLISYWCFMIKEYNTDAIKGIVTDLRQYEKELKNTEPASFFNKVKYKCNDSIKKIKDFLSIDTSDYFGILKIVMMIICFFSFYVYIVFFFSKRYDVKKENIVIMLLTLAGSLFLIIFLVIWGRPILRAVLCILIPFISITFIFLLKHFFSNIFFFEYDFRSKRIAAAVFLGSIIILGTNSFPIIKADTASSLWKPYYDYTTAHPENIYIYTDPSATPVDIHIFFPKNLVFWGGSAVYSDFYYQQMYGIGLKELVLDTLNQSNVFLITTDCTANLLKEKIEKDMNGIPIAFSLESKITDTAGIYKFYW